MSEPRAEYEYLPSGMRRSPAFIKATSEAWKGWNLLRHESDRGCALVAGAVLDELLGALLRAYFVHDKKCQERLFFGSNAPLRSWSARIDMCYALDLVSQTVHHDLTLLRTIRNSAAHFDKKSGFGTGFDSSSVEQKCRALRLAPASFSSISARIVFEAVAGAIGSSLHEISLILKFLADNTPSREIVLRLMHEKPWTDGNDESIRSRIHAFVEAERGRPDVKHELLGK